MFSLQDHGLDLVQLMSSSPYKDIHREAMITWSEAIREKDSTHFCRLAIEEADPQKVWLVVDARRETDMDFFKTHFGGRDNGGRCSGNVLAVQIVANPLVRQTRGWLFTPHIDDAPSECGLDQHVCDITIENNNDDQQLLTHKLKGVTEWVQDKLNHLS